MYVVCKSVNSSSVWKVDSVDERNFEVVNTDWLSQSNQTTTVCENLHYINRMHYLCSCYFEVVNQFDA